MIKGKGKTRISRRDLLKSAKRSKAQIRDRTGAKGKPYNRQAYDGHYQEREREPQ